MPKRAMLTMGGALAALLLLACGDGRLSPEEYFPRVQTIADDLGEAVDAGVGQLDEAGADPAASETSLVGAVRALFVALSDALADASEAFAGLTGSEPGSAEDAHAAFAAEAAGLADAFREVSDGLADAASFDDVNAVLEPLDTSFGLDADFLAACEGLERAADDAGQRLDLLCALDLIPEDAFTAANPDAAYFEALQAVADATDETLAIVAIAYTAATDEAASEADLIAAIDTFFRENALALDAAAEAGEELAPPEAVRAVHDAFMVELRRVASAFGEIAWRVANAEGGLDEVNAILESLPETFGRPPAFTDACAALEGAAGEAGFALALGCEEG